jgi:hypothetical protein
MPLHTVRISGKRALCSLIFFRKSIGNFSSSDIYKRQFMFISNL